MGFITKKAIERLKDIHKQAKINCNSNTDAEALETKSLYPDWETDCKEGDTLEMGIRVNYKDVLYKVLQTHQKQETWNPIDATSLFAQVLIPNDEEIPEWKESFVKVAYIPEGILEGKNDLTVAEVLKELSSDSVGDYHWGPYHKNVYNTNLKLQDREVTALIIEYNYKAYHLETMIFVYDNLLVVISIDLDLWDISWFQYFGFAPLQ